MTGLDFAAWSSDRNSQTLINQVNQDEQQAATRGFKYTPTVVVQGAKGEAAPIVGNTDYSTLEAKIRSVS